MSTRMEELILKYKNNYRRIQKLEERIAQLTVTKEEVIKEQMFSPTDGEHVQTSNVTDRTASVAATVDKILEKYNEELAFERVQYEQEKASLEKENALVEEALNEFEVEKREFAKDLIRGVKWDVLSERYHVSRATVANWRKEVICKLETSYFKVEQDLMRELIR